VGNDAFKPRKRVIVAGLAALLATLGLSAPAGASRPGEESNPADGPPKEPTVPSEGVSPKQTAGIQSMQVMDSLRSTLAKQFPDSFGGMYSTLNPEDLSSVYTVLTVGSSSELRDYVDGVLDATRAHLGIAQPTEYRSVERTYAQLVTVADGIESDRDYWESHGLPFYGTGVDDKVNVVDLYTKAPAGKIVDELAERYGSESVRVVVTGEIKRLTTRNADTAPWNAGDRIFRPDGASCSTGFGVHNGYGHFSITAGHCGENGTPWKNNASGYAGYGAVGSTAAFTFANNDADDAIIYDGAGSSKLSWKQAGTKVDIQAPLDAGNHATVCGEGSWGLEACGEVGSSHTSATIGGITTRDVFYYFTGDTIPGDSGGPIIQPTGYGYLATGTIIAGGSAYSVGLNITGTLDRYSAQLNTPVNP
jgi:hypothetical protein